MKRLLVLLGLWGAMVVAAMELPGYLIPDSKILSRRKRYVVFPEGSTFSVALCLTYKALTGESSIFTGGLAWAISYDLPNETQHDDYRYKGSLLPAPEIFRRNRRDLYRKVEVAMDSAGLDGRACILRTICESAQRLIPRSSLFVEMFRILFTLPLETVAPHEPSEHLEYDSAHRSGLAEDNCVEMFPTCHLSLLDMFLKGPEMNI